LGGRFIPTWTTIKKRNIIWQIEFYKDNKETDRSLGLERSADGYKKSLSLSSNFAGVGTSNFSLGLRLWICRAFQILAIRELVTGEVWNWSGLAFWEYKECKLLDGIHTILARRNAVFYSCAPSTAISMTVLPVALYTCEYSIVYLVSKSCALIEIISSFNRASLI
jgi:hypothetical protein